MSGPKFMLVWILSVIAAALIGYGIGWLLWKAGLELIGSAVALLAAAVGGFVVFFLFMRWSEERRYR